MTPTDQHVVVAGPRIGGREPRDLAQPAAAGEHLSPVLGRHAEAEPVAALAHQSDRLIGSLHRPCRLRATVLVLVNGQRDFDRAAPNVREYAGTRAFREPPANRARYRVK